MAAGARGSGARQRGPVGAAAQARHGGAGPPGAESVDGLLRHLETQRVEARVVVVVRGSARCGRRVRMRLAARGGGAGGGGGSGSVPVSRALRLVVPVVRTDAPSERFTALLQIHEVTKMF